MVEYTIQLAGGADGEAAKISHNDRDDLCILSFRYRQKTIEESATDFFGALVKVRIHLEKEGLIPICYGASLNVYPSGMCRDMGDGLMAYRVTAGKPANRKMDLVMIFDAGPDIIPATIKKQKEYFRKWFQVSKA